MRLLLIRHGETVDNVAGIYAGVRDSPLTTHGVLQASRLASHLSNIKISHIFSSDLQRAFKTAEAVRLQQSPSPAEVVKLALLREQDFGFYEGKPFLERQKGSGKSGKDAHREIHATAGDFQDVETKESMKARMDTFIDSHLVEHLRAKAENEAVVIVAHGIILSHLWRCILRRFDKCNVSLAAGILPDSRMGLEYLGGWSNTGYLDLDIKEKTAAPVSRIIASENPVIRLSPTDDSSTSDRTLEATPPSLYDRSHAQTSSPKSKVLKSSSHTDSALKLWSMSLVVKAVNNQEHLRGLKKTRGGIGSAQHDDKQQTMDSFFKKRRIE